MLVLSGEGYPSHAAGGLYTVAAQRDGDLQREALAVWRFISQAERLQGQLVLHPPGEGGDAPPLEAFPDVPYGASPATGARLTVFTSGTTGAPKPVTHDVAALLARSRARVGVRSTGIGSTGNGAVWLLTYRPWRWAGVSVLIHAFTSGSAVAVPKSPAVNDVIEALLEGSVTAISLTPSLLRRILTSEASGRLTGAPLRQITLGGEAAAQDVLDRARSVWPLAQITHVYASTEHTDIFAVSDGKTGFPAEKLDRADLRVDGDGQLWVRGQPTGDFWRRAGGRYVFRGRAGDTINVGGALVSLVDLEDQVRAVDGVRDARTYAMPNPILQNAAALEYVGTLDARTLRGILATRLPRAALPVKIDRVTEIALSDAMKVQRR